MMVGRGLGGRIETTVLDVRRDDQVREWISGLAKKEGKLDGAANVAGVSGSSKPCSVENIVPPPSPLLFPPSPFPPIRHSVPRSWLWRFILFQGLTK